MTHTPGPWWNEDLVICAKGPDGKTIYPARVYIYEPITREEARGNASIFAAALDLLAALEAVEYVDKGGYGLRCVWCDCGKEYGHNTWCPRQLALAKARGE